MRIRHKAGIIILAFIILTKQLTPEVCVASVHKVAVPENTGLLENAAISEDTVLTEDTILPEKLTGTGNQTIPDHTAVPEDVADRNTTAAPDNIADLNDVAEGDHIAVPNDISNRERGTIQDDGHAVNDVLKDWSYTETDDRIILIQYTGASTDIVIPGTIDGKQVFLQNSGTGTGMDRFPESTTSLVLGTADQKVKVTGGNASHLFSGLTNLTYLDARGLDTSDITTMYRMFFNCGSLRRLDLSGWDTGNVTTMEYMFQACRSLNGLDLSGWDTGNVTSMYSMFRGCNSLTGLDLRRWNTANVTDMSCMFYSCSSLTELDLSGWDTGNITGDHMDAMFYNCSGLVRLNVSGWNTTRVMSLQNMFFNCSSLERLDLSSWDTGNVVSMNYMFYCCSSLAELNINGWDTSQVISMLYMYNNCRKLQILDLSGHDYSNVIQSATTGIFDLEDDSAMLPTLIISNSPLIQIICDGPVAGRVPAGPIYHFGDGTVTADEGSSLSTGKYFDTLWAADLSDFTVSSIAGKYLPVKEGAVFSGWYMDELYTQPMEEAGGTMGLSEWIHVDLYAKYLNQYTVTFVDHDGSILRESLVIEGDSATAPEENPERDGYVFIGWDRDFENITENLIVTALYEKKSEAPEDTDEEDDNQESNGEEGGNEDNSDNEEGGDRDNSDQKDNSSESSDKALSDLTQFSSLAKENAEETLSDGVSAHSLERTSADTVQTGDTAHIGFYMLLLISSLLILGLLKAKKF